MEYASGKLSYAPIRQTFIVLFSFMWIVDSTGFNFPFRSFFSISSEAPFSTPPFLIAVHQHAGALATSALLLRVRGSFCVWCLFALARPGRATVSSTGSFLRRSLVLSIDGSFDQIFFLFSRVRLPAAEVQTFRTCWPYGLRLRLFYCPRPPRCFFGGRASSFPA